MARMGPRMGPNEGPNEGPYPKKLSPPAGFAWVPPFDVAEVAPREFTTTLNVDSLKVATSATRYVNGARADNSGGGTTPALAYRAIWAPLNFIGSTPTTIYVLGSADRNNPTVYPAADAWLLEVTADINVIVVSDLATLAPGWAVSSVESNPTAINGYTARQVSVYVERLGFKYGNARAFYMSDVTQATFVDCDFTLGTQSGASVASAAINRSHTLYFIRCRSYANQSGDGFTYTATGAGSTTRALEWDCEGFSNAGASTQGSSAHLSAGATETSIVRVGGRYYNNGAQEVADVGGKTWMLGSYMDGVDMAGIGYTMSGTGTAWLHGCVLTGNAIDLTTDNAGGTINVYDTDYRTTSGAGTVQAYVP